MLTNSDIFHISAQNIDCVYPQSMIFSKIRKIMHTPVNPIYYIKEGFKRAKII